MQNGGTGTSRKIKPINILSFGLGDLYGGGAFFLISVFTLYYLINYAHLSPLLAGLVIGLGKIIDALTDPVMGYLTDRTKNKRFGRRRIWLLAGIIPVAVTFILLWLPIAFGSTAAAFAYYLVVYILFYMVFTMVMVPYSSLPADMTTDFTERNRLSGSRIIFSQIGTLIAGIAAQPIVNAFADAAQGHFVMGCIFAALFSIPWIFVVLGTWEMPSAAAAPAANYNIFRNFATVLRNRAFRVQILMYIFSYTAMDIVMAWLKFYTADYLHLSAGLFTICLGSILISQIIALPFYIMISNKKSSRFAYTTGLVIWASGMVMMGLQQPGGPGWLIIINCVTIGLGLSAGVFIPYQLLPFVTDVDEMITGEKRAGTYSGSMTLIRKLIQGAFVIPLLGIILTAIGYVTADVGTKQADIIQSAATLSSMRVLFVGVPLFFLAMGLFIARFMNLDKKRHTVLISEITRRSAGGKPEDVAADVKKVCEELTGHKYSRLFGAQ